MKLRTTLKTVGVAIAAVIVAAVSTAGASAAPAGKKFTWSTTSPVALEATAQVIRATETFQFEGLALVLDPLRHDVRVERASERENAFHDRRTVIHQQPTHERAIDLQRVHRQLVQVAQR